MSPGLHSSRFYLSAAHKSSGKTLVSTGLCAEFRRRTLTVQAFKKGPDYIDPLWLGAASGRPCLNLDFHTQDHEAIRAMFTDASRQVNVALIEGNKGLYDGVSVDGSDCNAELAAQLSTPVILVLDTQGTTRGIAPMLLGYQQFEPRINIAGVILNKIAGSRHEGKLRANVEAYTDIPVFGAIPRDPALEIEERHLGLVPSSELKESVDIVERVRKVVAASVDVSGLLEVGASAPAFQTGPVDETRNESLSEPDIRVGIPRDRVFGFYYADDFEAMKRAGAEIRFFDSLSDPSLPDEIDALYLGGGFPEVHMEALQENSELRGSIREFVSAGGPVYAECGGMMYLGQSINWGDRKAEMAGALPFRVHMESKPVGRGYVELEETGRSPWGYISTSSDTLQAHEFHYSRLEILDDNPVYAYRVKRGWGIDGNNDGLVYGNTLASYSHMRSVGSASWVARFVAFARHCRQNAGFRMMPTGS